MNTIEKGIDLPDQVNWWITGEGWLHKDGHFNFNHYCNVIKIKNENLRNNPLLSGNPEVKEENKKILCRSIYPKPR